MPPAGFFSTGPTWYPPCLTLRPSGIKPSCLFQRGQPPRRPICNKVNLFVKFFTDKFVWCRATSFVKSRLQPSIVSLQRRTKLRELILLGCLNCYRCCTVGYTKEKRGREQRDNGAVVAGAGLEPATFGLWARRATNCSTPLYL